MADTLHFFKRNVNYSIGIKNFQYDRDGVVLNAERPILEVKEENLKDFKEANKKAILGGLLIEIEEPAISWETVNALTDEDISDLLKNFLKLKNVVSNLDSLPILYKIQEAAKDKDASKKTLSLIQARIDEIKPDDDVFVRPDEK